MTPEILTVLIILGLSIIVFVSGIIRMDIASLLILLALALTGTVTPEEALGGFSNNAVIAVIGIFIISEGLEYCGVADKIGKTFQKIGGNNEAKLVMIVMLTAAVFSSVMNNVAATSLVFPAVMNLSSNTKIPPSKFLIPLAFGSSLGGMLTLIGTPPNLIVSSLLQENGFPPFHFFDFTPAALIIAAAGIAFMALYGRKLLPSMQQQNKLEQKTVSSELANIYKLNEVLYEADISTGSSLVGKTLAESGMRENHSISVFAIIRSEVVIMQPEAGEKFRANDKIYLSGSRAHIEEAEKQLNLKLTASHYSSLLNLALNDTGLMEAALSPRSRLDSCTLREAKFRDRFGVNVVGIWRQGKAITAGLGDITLQLGDALLLQGPWRQFNLLKNEPDLIILGEAVRQYKKEKAPLAVIILILALLPAIFGILPIALSALAGAVLMIITRCIPVEQAYRNIQWSTIFIMAGTLPLSSAISKTGTADFISQHILSYISSSNLFLLIIVIFSITVLLCISTPNVASTIIMAPIALTKAVSSGINPHILLLAVAFASSTTFITPVAHQSNIIVMGAGGYKYKDYVRVGIPLTIVVMLAVSLALTFLY